MKRRRLLARDEGMVALEFALLSPVFLLLVFGVMAFTIYFAILVAVIHASAEGARASVAGMTDTERASLAQSRVTSVFQSYAPLLSSSRATVTAAAGSTSGTFTVKVSYPASDFDMGAFYGLLTLVDSKNTSTAPNTISHTETVANGGY